MKINIFTTIAFTFLVTVCFGQKQYYWSHNQKIFLEPDSSLIITYYKKTADENMIKTKIQSIAGQAQPLKMQIGKKRAFLVTNKSSNFKKFFDSTQVSFNEVLYRLPVYKLDNLPCYFTNEILLEPQKGVDINKILDLVKGRVDSVKRTEYNYYIITANRLENIFSIANKIFESKLVKWCHPNFLAQLVKTGIPPDPLFVNQYYLRNTGQNGGTAGIDINVISAWDITLGDPSIRVAMIDDGVEDHEDLSGRVLAGNTPVTGGNGSPVRDYYYDSDNQDTVRVGHGEATTGIVAASQNNLGISGIAPTSKIIPINIFAGGETAEDIANGINWAWNPAHGNADILSNSWGFKTSNSGAVVYADVLITAIGNARTQGRVRNGVALGCIVVFSSGNSNQNFSGVTFPANVDGVITVGAIDSNGNIWNYSSRGPEMDLVALSGGANGTLTYLGGVIPSGDVYSTDRMGAAGWTSGNYTTTFNGTSVACPQVSGVAALMLSVAPSLTETQVRTFLQQTATDMGPTGFDNTYGYGRLNAYAAVMAARNTTIYINGPKFICSSSVYSIYNLPANAIVTWSIPSNVGPVLQLSQNVPATNQLTITNQHWYTVSTTLTATVTVGSNSPVTYTLPISNDNSISAPYTQDACTCYNVYHPAQSGTASSISATFVHMCCDVRVYLNLPPNKTVTFGGNIAPNYWYYSGGILYFSLPIGSSGTPFTFNISPATNDGECSSSLVFFTYTNNGNASYAYMIAPNPVNDMLNIVVADNSASSTTEISSANAIKKDINLQFTAKIYDIMFSKFITSQKSNKGDKFLNINVSSLKAGNYVVIIDDGTQKQAIKFYKSL
jgi:subtilisin family serine protease